MDHAGSGQVLPIIVMDLDINPTAKTKDPLFFSDFRPISLIGCLYKIISTILASRLKRVIRNCIYEVQSAYVEGSMYLGKKGQEKDFALQG
uniref:Reverse transcriptase domain-containing protein n=1 Tax=Lactuca sativa TaxID=4236 RepID=A0A9R1VLN2_LACSA|nr:hypothetical protein LSAT_V11C400182690 [Lactuca sativa]